MRKVGEIYFKQPGVVLEEAKSNENKILFIDELDFLFSDEIFGESYAVGSRYTSNEVVDLFKFIWKKRYRNINLEDIFKSTEYKNLFSRNKILNELKKYINNKIKQIFEDSKKMETHSYVVGEHPITREKAIGYKELDDI